MRRFKTKPASKYGARKTRGYASKREATYAEQLAAEKQAGTVVDWLEQVPIKLPGKSKYIVDFLVFASDGTFKFVEVKGVETEVWRLKMRLLEETRPELFARLEVVK